MLRMRMVAVSLLAILLIFLSGTHIFAASSSPLPRGRAQHHCLPDATGPVTNQLVLVFQQTAETIEHYDSSTGTLTLAIEEHFDLPAVPSIWIFVPVPSDSRLDGGTFSWVGLGTCEWVPAEEQVECIGSIVTFHWNYRYRYQPPVAEGRFTHSSSTTWTEAVADVTWDLYYPESITVHETSSAPIVEEEGHVRWVAQQITHFEAQVTASQACRGEWIDKVPNDALDRGPGSNLEPDSANFFLRENNDHENLHLYYRIDSSCEPSEVEIRIYEGMSTEPKWRLPGKVTGGCAAPHV